MSSIHLFTIKEKVSHLSGSTVLLESSLQRLIEENMEIFFEVTFLASEYSTGPVHGGRIDSLGLDDMHITVRRSRDSVLDRAICPVENEPPFRGGSHSDEQLPLNIS